MDRELWGYMGRGGDARGVRKWGGGGHICNVYITLLAVLFKVKK